MNRSDKDKTFYKPFGENLKRVEWQDIAPNKVLQPDRIRDEVS